MKYSINCENKYRICRKWIFEAESKEEAWKKFIAKRGNRGWKHIEINEI